MLFRPDTLDAIVAGRVAVAYRRWRRPSVREGGMLLTPAGQLAIDAVEPIAEADISEKDAIAAGSPSLPALLADLAPEGTLYRIRFHVAGPDPRIALRETADLSPDELAAVLARLRRFDAASATGPWTAATLGIIRDRPGVVSSKLAALLGRDRPSFKLDVRKLKALGLTESLEVGYRLSPRGVAVLAALER